MATNLTPLTELELEEFIDAYLRAALLAETDDKDAKYEATWDIHEFTPTSREEAKQDCVQFINENVADLTSAMVMYELKAGWTPFSQAGRDFLMSRNNPGAGFLKAGLGEFGDRLQDVCNQWGICSPYVGEDGKLYLGGTGNQSAQEQIEIAKPAG